MRVFVAFGKRPFSRKALLDVKKFADTAENEPFEVPKRVGGSGGALTNSIFRPRPGVSQLRSSTWQ